MWDFFSKGFEHHKIIRYNVDVMAVCHNGVSKPVLYAFTK